MQTFPLGPFTVGRVGFGAMQLPGPGVFGPPRDHDQAIAVLRRAIELGVNHIDTAQFYGPNVSNELIREALHPYPADLALVTKVGGTTRRHGRVAARPGTRRAARQPRGEPAPRWASTGSQRRTCGCSGTTTRASPAEVDRELFDRQLTAMIKARDEGLIAGIGLSSITIEHLQIALAAHRDRLRAERVQPRRPHITAGARRVHRT